MSRPSRVRRLALLALLAAAGCQDYNFNPVGRCVLQPGSQQVKLSDISTADILFVVDDSGSMGGEQDNLAASFAEFIAALNASNTQRAASGLEPVDFHVAITTTSVFMNNPSTAYCKASCPGASGTGNVCCRTSGATLIGPLKQARRCAGPGDASCGANTCSNACNGYLGEYVCCDGTNSPDVTADVACETLDDPCGNLQTHYQVGSSCVAGNAVNGEYYPHGSFIGFPGNPRVLHFDKTLYPKPDEPQWGTACTNKQGFTASELIQFFQENVKAGTCGSGQEQGFLASKLAIEKALAGEQLDTFKADDPTHTPQDPPVRAEWLHPNSKLVVAYIGDEDDCSSPESATKGVILVGNPGSDSCVNDPLKREDALDAYVSLLSRQTLADGSPRPAGAAFIVSATPETCIDASCSPGLCTDPTCTEGPDMCGGQAPGTRFLTAASDLRFAGVDVMAGSICSSFGANLERMAEIVKPPTGLVLPTLPAASEVTQLRISGKDGKTRKVCSGPAPAGTSLADALAHPYDWWFTASAQQETDDQKAPTGPSKYVYINHLTQNCEASPGENYAANYVGQLPQGGCWGATPELADAACGEALGTSSGGQEISWTCYAGVVDVPEVIDGESGVSKKCVQPVQATPGSCICGPRGAATASWKHPDQTGNCSEGSTF